MRVLAIDSGNPVLGVAALETQASSDPWVDVLHLREIDTATRHIESLPRIVKELLSELDWTPSSLEGVVAGAGPGSFTGLRVGLAAAKGIAMAVGCPLASIDSLEAFAHIVLLDSRSRRLREVPSVPDLILPIIDARKGRFYTALFEPLSKEAGGTCPGNRRVLENLDVELESLAEVLGSSITGVSVSGSESSNSTPGRICVAVGPGDTAALIQHLAAVIPMTVIAVSAASAVRGVARLGSRALQEGRFDDPWTGPNYLRSADVGAPRKYPGFTPSRDPSSG